LSKLLPEDQVQEVASAVEEMFNEGKEELEAEYNTKLEEAYEELSKEKEDAETVAEKGYQEAYEIIQDLRSRLETQKNEFDVALEEGYEEAYQMLKSERSKNDNIEVELYEEYETKLKDMKEYFVDKIDEFLEHKGDEIYEQAKKDILNDPRMVEHKLTLSKIVDTVSGYISDEDYAHVSNSKLEEAHRAFEDIKGQMKILEAKNIRVSAENNKLNEQVRQSSQVIKEHQEANTVSDRKERKELKRTVQGSGKTVSDDQIELIKEHQETERPDAVVNEDDNFFDEKTLSEWTRLSGVKGADQD